MDESVWTIKYWKTPSILWWAVSVSHLVIWSMRVLSMFLWRRCWLMSHLGRFEMHLSLQMIMVCFSIWESVEVCWVSILKWCLLNIYFICKFWYLIQRLRELFLLQWEFLSFTTYATVLSSFLRNLLSRERNATLLHLRFHFKSSIDSDVVEYNLFTILGVRSIFDLDIISSHRTWVNSFAKWKFPFHSFAISWALLRNFIFFNCDNSSFLIINWRNFLFHYTWDSILLETGHWVRAGSIIRFARRYCFVLETSNSRIWFCISFWMNLVMLTIDSLHSSFGISCEILVSSWLYIWFKPSSFNNLSVWLLNSVLWFSYSSSSSNFNPIREHSFNIISYIADGFKCAIDNSWNWIVIY